MPEGRRIFPNLSVRDNLDLGSYRRAAARRAANRERVFAIFPRLYERRGQSAGTLSGGEQQMLAIGRGLMAEPRLLILDEPSLGLSPLLVEELFALIARIHADGVAVLLVEQNVVQSLEIAGRAYILAEGQCVMSGRPPTSAPIRSLNALIWDYESMTEQTLAARLAHPPILVAPGVYDALTALIAARAGFEALYVSGAGIAYSRLGRPDIGLVSMSEVAETVTLIRDRVEAHLIVDADTGYGNALNVQRTVRLLERAGANAIQIEDQDFPKRCGHLDDKTLVSAQEMAGKIKAAVDARTSRNTLIIARTDALAVEGFDRALARVALYRDAGADVLFVEAPRQREELSRIGTRLGKSAPLMVNMVEGGKTPMLPAAELEALGFSLAIFPGAIVRTLAKAAEDFYVSLKADGSTDPFRARMFDFDALNRLIGTPEMLDLGKRYAEEAPQGGRTSGQR